MLHLQHYCAVLCLVFSLIVILRKESCCSPNARKPLATNILRRITRNVNFESSEGGDCDNQHRQQLSLQKPVRNKPFDQHSNEMHGSSGLKSTVNNHQHNLKPLNRRDTYYPSIKDGDVNVHVVIPILQMRQNKCPAPQLPTPPHTSANTTRIWTCPDRFIHANDGCYYFSSLNGSWHDTQRFCKRINSELAHPIRHSNFKTHLQNYDNERSNWWIGGTDEGQEGKWVWIHDRSPFSYTHWAGGQPSNSTTKNCLYLMGNQDYLWADESCNMEKKCICQTSPHETF